jgi:hypothetical protein
MEYLACVKELYLIETLDYKIVDGEMRSLISIYEHQNIIASDSRHLITSDHPALRVTFSPTCLFLADNERPVTQTRLNLSHGRSRSVSLSLARDPGAGTFLASEQPLCCRRSSSSYSPLAPEDFFNIPLS